MKSLSRMALLGALAAAIVMLAAPQTSAQIPGATPGAMPGQGSVVCSQRHGACLQRCRPGNANCINSCTNLLGLCIKTGKWPSRPRKSAAQPQ